MDMRRRMLSATVLPTLIALSALLVGSRITTRERDRTRTRQSLAISVSASLSTSRSDTPDPSATNPWIAPCAVLGVGLVMSSPALAVTGPLVCLGVRAVRRQRSARRSRAQDDLDLLAIVDETGHGLRSGISLASAFLLACRTLAEGGASSVQLARIADSVRSGARLDASLTQILETQSFETQGSESETGPSDNLRLVSVAMSVMLEFGGSATAGVDRLAQTLRASHSASLNQRAQASQATASASLLAGLPLAFGTVLAVADGRIARFYAFTAGGAVCIVGSLGLATIGWLWMDRLIWR